MTVSSVHDFDPFPYTTEITVGFSSLKQGYLLWTSTFEEVESLQKTFIGSFPNQQRLVAKIVELKIDGVAEEDMSIVMKDEKAVEQLILHADKDGEDSPYNLFNRFMGFHVGEKNVRQMLRDSGFTDSEAKHYFDAVQEGALLLYINGRLSKEYSADEDHPYDQYAPIPLDEIEAGEQ